jgi:hypothetical protein
VWVAWPLRGNQEAPSQPGGHARCSSRNTAFVRASWVGPPNRASPMRGFGVAVETCGAVRERVGRRTNQGSVHAGIRTRRLGPCDTSCAHRSLPPTGALPMRGSAIVLGMVRAMRALQLSRGQTGRSPCWLRDRSRNVRSGTCGVGRGRCRRHQTGWCHTTARGLPERHALRAFFA